MKFQRETVTPELLEECAKLFLAYHLEVSENPEMVLAPNPKQHILADQAGLLRWFIMRNDLDLVVGYFVFVVTQALHDIQEKQAHQEMLFIQKDYRGKNYYEFQSFAVQYLTEVDAVKKIYFNASTANNFHLILERQGLKLALRTYEMDTEKFSSLNQELNQAKTVRIG